MTDITSHEVGSGLELNRDLQLGLLENAQQILKIKEETEALLRIPSKDIFRGIWNTRDEGRLSVECATAEARGLPFPGERSFTVRREYLGEGGKTHDVVNFCVTADGRVRNPLSYIELVDKVDSATGKRPPKIMGPQITHGTLFWIRSTLDNVLNHVQSKKPLERELFQTNSVSITQDLGNSATL